MTLYIHVPFCDSKCGYCAFKSFDNQIHFKDRYLNALKLDLEYSFRFNDVLYLTSIYIGGGTPNVLQPSDYEDIFLFLKPYLNANAEVTMELNPNNADSSLLADFVSLGINRFSIGVQSFYKNKLNLLQRIHNPKKAIKFIENAISSGVNNVSIDLIYDTSLDTKESLCRELHIANSLGIGHISCYMLSIDEDSKFYEKNISPIANNSLCYELQNQLDKLGFFQYEVSNFAKTHKSYHNLSYWNYEEYIGVGLSAVGRIGNTRLYKQNSLLEYVNNPNKCHVEELSNNEINLEKLFLGLRSEIGVELSNISNKRVLEYLVDTNELIVEDSRVYSSNYFLADEYTLRLS